MANYLPNFNLLCDMWVSPDVPAFDLPTYMNVPAQLYVASKGLLDITPGVGGEWVPPIYLRVSITSIAEWTTFSIVECPVGSGEYLKVRWKEHVHRGFPNEYLTAIVEQCDDQGNPIFRYVT